MTNHVTAIALFACLVLAPVRGAADSVGNQDERVMLEERRLSLVAKIAALTEEQDLLRFRHVMLNADSKYVIINARSKSGTLMYKNRVLLDFRYIPSKGFQNGKLPQGALELSRKVEGKGGRHALIFGSALILQWKRSNVPPQEADVPYLSLTKKDLLAVYNAVEDGAKAYVIR